MGPFLILSLFGLILPIHESGRAIDSSNQINVESSTTSITVSVRVPRRTSVGSKKAGLICLPQGRFQIEDFVDSEAYLKTVILDSFAQRVGGNYQFQSASIALVEVKVSLCAKDHLFNGDLYSGTATFTFVIVSQSGVETKLTVPLKIEKSQARSEREIFELAADRLIEMVLEQRLLADSATPDPAQ